MNDREMRYHRRLQKAIDHIENHLKEELPLREVSDQANISVFHFHRLFRAFTGFSLAEYIRERRMFLAAVDLVETGKRITDISLEYGYSAPESFLRAFRERYGNTPRGFRHRGKLPPFMAKVNLMDSAYISAKGRLVMNPKIKRLDSMNIIGTRISTDHGSCHDDVSRLWNELRKGSDIGKTIGLDEVEAVYGICYGSCNGCSCTGGKAESREENESFSYFVGYHASDTVPSGGAETTSLKGGEYAVFSLNAEDLRDTMDRIYTDWLPASGYELGKSPVIERYGSDWQSEGQRMMEILLPIKDTEV